jgi:hypothetical protein
LSSGRPKTPIKKMNLGKDRLNSRRLGFESYLSS